MKALFNLEDGDVHIELISESQEEREFLLKMYANDSMAVSCEEWREAAALK